MREMLLLLGFSTFGWVILGQHVPDPGSEASWPAPRRTKAKADKVLTNKVVVVTEAGTTVTRNPTRTRARITNYTDIGGFVAATNAMTNAQSRTRSATILDQAERASVPSPKPAQRSKMNISSANPTNQPRTLHTVRGKISADEPGFGEPAQPATNKLTDVDPLP